MIVPLAEVNAFHIIGGIFAVWAVIVSTLGFMSADFPKGRGLQRAVVVVSAILLASTVGAAIATSEKHEPDGGHGENPTHEGEPAENIKNE